MPFGNEDAICDEVDSLRDLLDNVKVHIMAFYSQWPTFKV